jgi:hypothetical protein
MVDERDEYSCMDQVKGKFVPVLNWGDTVVQLVEAL